VHTGDIVYYDHEGPWVVDAAQARLKWNQMYAFPFQRAFHNDVSSYFLRDDHDTWQNDCWPSQQSNRMGQFTYAEGVNIFFEQVPAPDRTKPWRTVRWGKDLQIWLTEGRDFRSPNTDPDGPDKTIWGAEQKAWFKKTVAESDAAFRILITPTPMVGPDRGNKQDNHANVVFKHEGDELRRFMADQKNMIAICGDRHWQYVSIDPETGLREYGTGAASNVHAGGFTLDQREPMHQYLAIIGGFLSCTVTREADIPILLLRHYDVDGKIVNEDKLTPETVLHKQ
jgi:alkaline phosphatase D